MTARRYHLEIQDQDGNLYCHADIAAQRVSHITARVVANRTVRLEVAGHLTAAARAHVDPNRPLYLHRWPATNTTRPPVTQLVPVDWQRP